MEIWVPGLTCVCTACCLHVVQREKRKVFIFKNVIFYENSVFWRISYQMMLSSYKCNTSLICKFLRKNIKSWHQNFSILFMHLIMSKQDQNPTHPTQVINHPIGENRA